MSKFVEIRLKIIVDYSRNFTKRSCIMRPSAVFFNVKGGGTFCHHCNLKRYSDRHIQTSTPPPPPLDMRSVVALRCVEHA
jgi:hypothetical protein